MIHTYNDIISLENLCLAWQEFVIGKKNKTDVMQFSYNLMDNIVKLHDDLVNKTYQHDNYESFFITDPKAYLTDWLYRRSHSRYYLFDVEVLSWPYSKISYYT